jgi:hypothetical protein
VKEKERKRESGKGREKESLCIKFVGKALLDENSDGEHTYKNKIVCV